MASQSPRTSAQPTEPHPLTVDRWAVEGQPELGQVNLSSISQIDRARAAIETIARIAANSSLQDPIEPGAPTLDSYTLFCLLGGVESLCDHMRHLTERMLTHAKSHHEWERQQ